MRTGDLVRFTRILSEDSRRVGTILSFDLYHARQNLAQIEGGTFRYQTPERLAKVLWNHGSAGWVLASRLEVIDGDV
jgi:hypothetical protein